MDRRTMIKRAAAGSAAVWVAPAVLGSSHAGAVGPIHFVKSDSPSTTWEDRSASGDPSCGAAGAAPAGAVPPGPLPTVVWESEADVLGSGSNVKDYRATVTAPAGCKLLPLQSSVKRGGSCDAVWQSSSECEVMAQKQGSGGGLSHVNIAYECGFGSLGCPGP